MEQCADGQHVFVWRTKGKAAQGVEKGEGIRCQCGAEMAFMPDFTIPIAGTINVDNDTFTPNPGFEILGT